MANDWIDVPAPAAAPKPAASAGGDWVDAPPAAAPKTQFPQDAPNTYYGNILPFSKDMGTGKVSLDAPEIVRSPARGAVDIYHRLTQPYQPADLKTLNPDELGLVASVGGVRAGPESVVQSYAPKAAAKTAHDFGYVLKPVDVSDDPGVVSSALAGWSGKTKLEQSASTKNQVNTNNLAATEIGLKPGTPLTEKAFADARKPAADVYRQVETSVSEVPLAGDEAFRKAAANLGGRNSDVEKFFPELKENPGILAVRDMLLRNDDVPTPVVMKTIAQLRADANTNFKAIGQPQQHALGLAQREAANVLEDAMERAVDTALPRAIAKRGEATADFNYANTSYVKNPTTQMGKVIEVARRRVEQTSAEVNRLQSADNAGLLDRYRDARKLFAKTYDIEAATNRTTGDVSARGLARAYNKGAPFTGNLKAIADAANEAPKVMQNPAMFGRAEDWSALDFFGTAASLAAGHPEAAGAILGRPVARGALLSGPYQRNMMQPTYGSGAGAAARQLFNPGLAPNPYDALGIKPP